jgi:sulfane dehydrogenase subunit SoxC
MNSRRSGRRRFLKGSAVALGAAALKSPLPVSAQQASQPAVIPNSGVRPVSEISQYEKLVRTGNISRAMTPLQDLQGMITPSHLHFYMNHEQGYLPNIDPENHTLKIFGMVDRPLVLTMADIKRLPAVSRIHFLECNANGNPTRVRVAKNIQEAHGLTSCSEWTGVPLSLLMQEVGAQRNAKWLIAMSADTSNHASSIPMEKAISDGMIVYGQNGDALRIDQGYPLRLLLPGYGGRINVKWLDRLKVVDQPYMTKQDRTSYMEHTPAGEGAFMLTSGKALDWHFAAYAKSVITSPTGGQKLPGPGLYNITGLAWSGGGAVRRVEVSTDGGGTWKDAQLQEPILRIAHTRFHFPWRWNGDVAKLQSRCTDENGTVQPSAAELEKNWDEDLSAACTEYMGDDCKRIPRRANRAYIMTWQVNRDGTVLNASNDLPDDDLIHGGIIHG